ncbi:MAG: hypothetical protein F4093_06220 [Gammaproteobacteria bacterium]|nr:hypothetical protein [Gammaproteobacteria bacterium]
MLAVLSGLPMAGPALSQSVHPPVPEPSLDAIVVCYDFGCKNRSTVSLPQREWQQAAGWFLPAAKTPAEERYQIKNAVGWMEVLIGRHTPTHKDLAFSLPPIDDYRHLFPGQQDCIDEAINTTTYLRLFEQHGLMRHHEVMDTAYRKAIFDQHWAAQIREKETGIRYVVDSWFQPNGYLPVIQASEKWEDIGLLSAVIDSSERPDPDRRR